MEASAKKNRVSPAVAGWIIGALCLVVPVLVFWPRPKEPAVPIPPLAQRTPSEIEKLGLPYNVDFEPLPAQFALWADQVTWWKDGRAKFAYRPLVSDEFIYFLEAIQTPEGIRFRVIERPEGAEIGDVSDPECPIRPLVRLTPASHVFEPEITRDPPSKDIRKVPVDLEVAPYRPEPEPPDIKTEIPAKK